MRKRYRRVYKEEMARLKAGRDFQIEEKKRIQEEKTKEQRKKIRMKRRKVLKKKIFHYRG